MGTIFISYRRGDSAGHTGRLFDALTDRFGKDSVFRDIEDLEPGIDFVEALDQALVKCDTLLVIIGDEWASVAGSKGRRLDQPDDFVRMEVAKALERNVRVIPVLVAGATMPDVGKLPEDLRALARRNAIELSDTRWEYDVGRLGDTLAKVLGVSDQTASVRAASPPVKPGATGSDAPPKGRLGARSFALIGGGALVGILVLFALFSGLSGDDPDTIEGPEMSWLAGDTTCPLGVGGCSKENQCTSCDETCVFCQNLDDTTCGPADCMTCEEGYRLVQVFDDGTGNCILE